MATTRDLLAEGDKPPSAAAIQRLGGIRIQELDGEWIELGGLWEDRPAALVFLRHYG